MGFHKNSRRGRREGKAEERDDKRKGKSKCGQEIKEMRPWNSGKIKGRQEKDTLGIKCKQMV